MGLTESQKLRKSEQDSKRYYENKLIKEKQKAIALEKKIQKEQDRKNAIKHERIYRFKHMNLKRPKYGPEIEAPRINQCDDIILNDIINSDDEIEPIPYEQPSRLKYNFV